MAFDLTPSDLATLKRVDEPMVDVVKQAARIGAVHFEVTHGQGLAVRLIPEREDFDTLAHTMFAAGDILKTPLRRDKAGPVFMLHGGMR